MPPDSTVVGKNKDSTQQQTVNDPGQACGQIELKKSDPLSFVSKPSGSL